MPLTIRLYQPDDCWRVRAFLRETLPLYDYRERNWPVARFDYYLWHGNLNIEHLNLSEVISIWETEENEFAAVLTPEALGEAFLQVHPAWRSLALEEEMLEQAEARLAKTGADGHQRLTVWAHAGDELRRDLLRRRGYQPQPGAEYQRRRPVDASIPVAPLSPGFSVRALGDGLELLERCYASGLAFHPDEPNVALENRQDPTWYRNIQTAPLYRRDLDLVAVAPDGAVAAFCTVWFDDVTRTGMFEPVGTVPAYQRRGLGKAVMAEGLRRLQRLGAVTAYVGSYSPRAHALYAAMGFRDYEVCEPWEKEIRG
ncbi:MAG TPA: GNAT family N-acetyltransferase [Anaerolineaceae bacterium]|nr:GNAT family N-acetyltransferase [Anaerolineaceae bacterium]